MPPQAVIYDGRLTISNIRPEDAGDYTCTASNEFETAEIVSRVQVDFGM